MRQSASGKAKQAQGAERTPLRLEDDWVVMPVSQGVTAVWCGRGGHLDMPHCYGGDQSTCTGQQQLVYYNVPAEGEASDLWTDFFMQIPNDTGSPVYPC